MKRGIFLKSAVGLFATPMLFKAPDRHVWTPPKKEIYTTLNNIESLWLNNVDPSEWREGARLHIMVAVDSIDYDQVRFQCVKRDLFRKPEFEIYRGLPGLGEWKRI